MRFKKVITHGGVFHADELVAIATLVKLGVIDLSTPIERVFKIDTNLIESDTLVLDIGGVCNNTNVFDHHQDGNLPATNLLVLNHFCDDKKLVSVLTESFFGTVSDIDKGVIKSQTASFSQIVSNFNAFENGFELALNFTVQALDAVWQVTLDTIRLESKYYGFEVIFNGKVKIQEDLEFVPNWKLLAEKDGVLMLVSPNARGGWQIVSRDSDVLTIPKNADGQTFCHNTGFMAVYETKEYAIKHAEMILNVIE